MCYPEYVRLSEPEAEQVRSLTKVLIPVYASVALALVAIAVFTTSLRPDAPVAVADRSMPAR